MQGEVELVSSGIGTYEVSWPARTEEPNGRTSPEELIAAAHSTCFSMSVANELVLGRQPGTDLGRHQGGRDLSAGQGITGIELTVRAVVPGIDAERVLRPPSPPPRRTARSPAR